MMSVSCSCRYLLEERESQSAKDVIVVADNYAMSAMRGLNVTQQKRTQQDVTPRRACPVTEIGLTLEECSRDACALQRREGGLSVSPSGGRFAAVGWPQIAHSARLGCCEPRLFHEPTCSRSRIAWNRSCSHVDLDFMTEYLVTIQRVDRYVGVRIETTYTVDVQAASEPEAIQKAYDALEHLDPDNPESQTTKIRVAVKEGS